MVYNRYDKCIKFEYDSNKSWINKQKHGVDFEEAKVIWTQDHLVIEAFTKGEIRYMIIGLIGLDLYSCIFTQRQDKIRLISCRRSSQKEKGVYYEKIQ